MSDPADELLETTVRREHMARMVREFKDVIVLGMDEDMMVTAEYDCGRDLLGTAVLVILQKALQQLSDDTEAEDD